MLGLQMELFCARLPTLGCLVTFFAVVTGVVQAAQRSYIIEDSDSSVTYSPADQWSSQPGCKRCLIKLDPSLAHGGDWHDATHLRNKDNRSFTISLEGTGVRVFNILANQVYTYPPTTETHLTFFLDGMECGSGFDHIPSSSPDPEFNALVYSTENLDNGPHTLVVQARPDAESVILFDFAEIIVEEPDPWYYTYVSSNSGVSIPQ